MAKTIAQPQVRFGGSLGPLLGQIDKLQGRLTSFSKKTAGLGSKVAKLGLKFGALGSAIGAAAAGAGLSVLVNRQLDAIDSSSKLADRLGLTTHAIEGLNHAAGLSGASSEAMTRGIERMLVNLGKAAEDGTGAAHDALSMLGLDAADLSKLNPEESFIRLADAIGKIEDPAKRALIINDVFGRSGQQLGNLFAAGGDNIRAMVAEADKLGLAFDRADGAKVEAANDAFARMRATITGVVRSITIAIAPALEKAATVMTGVGAKAVASIRAFLPKAIALFTYLGSRVTGVLQSIGAWAMPWLTMLGQFWQDRVGGIVQSTLHRLNALVQLAKGIGSAILTLVTNLWDATLGLWLGSVDELTASTEGGGNKITATLGWIADGWQWLQDKITAAVYRVSYTLQNLQAAFDIVGTSIGLFVVRTANQITHLFTEVIPSTLSWFADNWQSILFDVATFAGTIFKNIASNAYEVFTNLPGLIMGSTDWSEVWTPLTEGFEATLSELPDIAEREIGGIEGQLALDLQTQRNAFSEGFDGFMREQQSRVDGALDDIAGNATPDADTTPDLPSLPDITLPELPEMTVELPDQATPDAPTVETPAVGTAVTATATLPKLANAFSAENLARTFGEGIELSSADVATDAADAAATAPQDNKEEVGLLKKLANEAKAQTRELIDLARRTTAGTVFTIPV
ncbi:MAG: hypothetical protein AAF561_00150 [Planctomycetota bacterium]